MSSAPALPLRSSRRARARRRTRLISLLLAPLVVLSTIGLGVWGVASAASAAAIPAPVATLALQQTGGAYGDADPKPFILAGEDATFQVSLKNASTAAGYNTSFALALPNGIDFVSSGGMGAPTIYPSGAELPNSAKAPPLNRVPAGQQLWVFMDASDLPANATFGSTLVVRPDASVFPVGTAPRFDLTGYVSGDPRYLPVFDGSTGVGQQPALDDTSSGTASQTVPVQALRVTKSEPSPEIELLRGVHDQPTTYTITVENTPEGPTNGVTLVDYLPAGLEFLACGTVDNTQDSPLLYTTGGALGGDREYPGAGPIDTSGDPGDCFAPASVETVNSGLPAGLAAGVYTKVTWNLPTLDNASSNIGVNGAPQGFPGTAGTAGAYQLKYRAAVPLFENTMTFVQTGGGSAPSPASGDQAANLNNNNGPSTRQGQGAGADPAHGDGILYTNHAFASGTYTGQGGPVTASDGDTEKIQAMDLRILKGVDTHAGPGDDTKFVTGGLATFTLDLATSEYTHSDGMTIVDTIPNGLCPALPAGLSPPLRAGSDPLPADCVNPTGSGASPTLTGATATEIDFDAATGQFELTLVPTPDAIAENGTARIQYTVLMRQQYQNSPPIDGNTSSGDTLTNHVQITGETHSRSALAGVTNGSGVPAFGDEDVWDDSQASIVSHYSQIQKQVLPRSAVLTAGGDTAADRCAVPPGSPWAQNQDAAGDEPFVAGDLVCYELTVDFAHQIDVRNPKITDFLPQGVDYVDAAVGAATTIPAGQVQAPTVSGSRIDWTVGTLVDGDYFAPRSGILVLHVLGRMTTVTPGDAATLDKPQNLMKYRQNNVAGDVFFLRDASAVQQGKGLQLLKGVQTVDGDPSRAARSQRDGDGNVFDSNRDGIQVKAGDVVKYRLDLTGGDADIDQTTVWDALPTGIRKSDVSAVTDGGTALDPGDPGYPANLDPSYAGRSVIVWTGLSVAKAAQRTLNYTVTIPATQQAATDLPNTASITQFRFVPNTGTGLVRYPDNSLDRTGHAGATVPGAGMRDDSDVYLPAPSVDKRLVSTEVGPSTHDLDPNNGDGQAVPGELIDYAYSVTIPAHTSVANAVLKDRGTLQPGGVAYTVHGTPTWSYTGTGTQPSLALSASGALSFGALYSNVTDDPEVFTVLLQVYVGDSWANGTNLDNQAQFTSASWNGTHDATVQFIKPDVKLTKSATPSGAVSIADDITYTLTATNTSGRPKAYDDVLVDTVPAGILVTNGSWSVTPVAFDAGVLTGAGGTITWNVAEVPPTAIITYHAKIDPSTGGGQQYTNTARIDGHTLPSSLGGDVDDRRTPVSATAQATVTAVTAAIDKGVRVYGTADAFGASASAPIGATAEYKVQVTLQPDINYYTPVISDVLPAGVQLQDATITGPADAPSGSVPGTWTYAYNTGTRTASWTYADGGGTTLTSSPVTRTLTLTYRVLLANTVAANVSSLTNTATFAWTHQDGTPGSVTDPARVTVLNPVLAIDKTVDGQSSIVANPAQTFTYGVKVTNTGNTPAYNAVIRDVVPAGVVVDASSITDGGTITGQDATTHGGGTITWNLAGPLSNVAGSNAKTFTYAATLVASANLSDANQVNTASVTHYESYPSGGRPYNPTNVNDTATVDPAFPAVVLAKTASGTDPAGADVAYANQPFPWTLTLVNNGQGPAQTISVRDVLPKNWTFDAGSARISVGGAASTALADPSVATSTGVQTLTWSTGQISATTPALPGTAGGATTAQRTITITFTATPTTAALTDAGVTQAGPPVVHMPHTNTLSATTTDTSGATGNAGGSYTGPDATANAYLDLADLVLKKDAIGGTASSQWIPGQAVTGSYTQPQWRITVTNQGPDAGFGPFTYVDTATLPAGVTVGAYSARYFANPGDTTGTALPITGTGTAGDPFVVGTTSTSLKADGSDRIVLTADVAIAASATGTASNTATVTGRTHETNTGNNTDTATQPLTPQADLAIDKKGPATPPNAGDPLAWILKVTNEGPSDSLSTTAKPITVTDTIPAGMRDVAVGTLPAGWTANGAVFQAGETVTFTLGDGLKLTPSQAVQFTLAGFVVGSQPAGTPISNTATVHAGATTDPNPSNDASTATTTPTTNTTLGIDKTRVVETSPGTWVPAVSLTPVPPVVPGQPVTYLVTITNTGAADARNVTVTDDLEDYLSYASFISVDGTWTHTAGTGAPGAAQTFALTGSLAGGASASFRITTNLSASWNAPVVNTAVGHADNSTNEPSDTDDSNSTRDADLKIEKSHTGTTVTAGTTAQYRLKVTNLGPSDSSGPIVVTDTLPAGFAYAAGSARVSIAGGAATALEPAVSGQVLTWTFLDASSSLAKDATIVIDFASPVAPTVTAGSYVNKADVTGPDDNDPSNNHAEDPTTVVESADLSVVKTAAPGPYVAGQSVTYTVTVTNAGPSVARNVSVVDAAPAGTTVTGLSGTGWTCDVATATCTMPELGVTSASFTVTASIAANVPDGTSLTNRVTVTSSTPDPTTPVTDESTITTVARADLGIVKTAVDASRAPITTADAGTEVRYLLQVRNHGPSDAVGPLTIVDTLPAGFSYVSIAEGGSAWTAAVDVLDPQKVTFTRTAGLAAGADADDLVFVALIDPAHPVGTARNTAVVSSPTVDPNPSNNTDTADVTITQSADLSITKTHVAGAVRIGDPLDFAITVRNAGPSTATGVTVVDTVPAGLTYVDAAHSDPAWTVTAAPVAADGTTAVTAVLTGTLAPGATAPALVLTTRVTPAAYASVTNTAVVTGDQPDPDPSDNTTDDKVTVPPQATLVLTKEALGAFQVGKDAQYRLTLTNNGPTEDPGPITITDELPSGLLFRSADAAGVTCAAVSRTVTCTVDRPLAVGASVQVVLTVAVGYAAYPQVANTATVTTPTEQLPPAQLTATAVTPVAAQPLPATGSVAPNAMLALALILFGLSALLLLARRRRTRS